MDSNKFKNYVIFLVLVSNEDNQKVKIILEKKYFSPRSILKDLSGINQRVSSPLAPKLGH